MRKTRRQKQIKIRMLKPKNDILRHSESEMFVSVVWFFLIKIYMYVYRFSAMQSIKIW